MPRRGRGSTPSEGNLRTVLTIADIMAQLNITVNKVHKLAAWLARSDLPLSAFMKNSMTAQDKAFVSTFMKKWHGRCSIQDDLRYHVAYDGSLQSVKDRNSSDSHFEPDPISQSIEEEEGCVNETAEENTLGSLPFHPSNRSEDSISQADCVENNSTATKDVVSSWPSQRDKCITDKHVGRNVPNPNLSARSEAEAIPAYMPVENSGFFSLYENCI